jgi:tetratricopeptide (TPR) repeat protein
MGKIYFETMQRNGYLPDGEQVQIPDSEQDKTVLNNFAFSHLDSLISEIRLIGLLNDWPFVDKPDFSFIKKLRMNSRIDSIAYKIAVENMNWEKGHREAADWYLRNKDYRDFAAEFLVIISQYPFKLADYDYAASELINLKEYELAYKLLLKRFRETPDAFSAKWLGNINLSQGNVDDAVNFLTESLMYDKSDAQVYYNLAGAYIKKKEFNSALQSIEHCLSIKSDFPNAQGLKAQLATILAK